jgi:uncharacterized protein (DUF1800 family)
MRSVFFGGRTWILAGAAFMSVMGAGLAAEDQPPMIPSSKAEIVHVLNRITFGPRPGDVERVEQMGLQAYIEQQLHPETIDDAAVNAKVARLATLRLTPAELVWLYREQIQSGIVRQLEQKTGDPNKEAQRKAALAKAGQKLQTYLLFAGAMPPNATPAQTQAVQRQMLAVIRARPAAELADAKLIREVDSNRQLYEVLVDFWSNHFNIDTAKNDCSVLKVVDDREVIRPHVLGKFRDLLEASAKSPAMLNYLDNALNSAGRAASAPVPGSTEMTMAQGQKLLAANQRARKGGINENYAREIMELHTLGVDGGYTQADVQEVARCFTGWTIDGKGQFVFAPGRHDNGPKTVLGHSIPANGGIHDGEMVLEILSSHPSTAHFISRELCQRFISDNPPASAVDRTAGVFMKTQGDLREVVRSIITSPEFLSSASFGSKIKSPLEFAVSAVRATGSTIAPPQPPPGLALASPPEMMAMLMSYPTGRSALTPSLRAPAPNKLASTAAPAASSSPARAMASTAPPAMESMMESNSAMTMSGPASPAAKARPGNQQRHVTLSASVSELGQPIFGCIPPTGYKEVSTVWVNPGALIDRLNFAISLAEQKVSDVRFSAHNLFGKTDLDRPEAILDQGIAALLPNGVSDSTRNVLASAAVPAPGDSKVVEPAQLVALLLGSPEFQRK